MKNSRKLRAFPVLVACAALALGACGETQLPDPTGKGSIRAINAIPGSPTVAFLIEERSLGSIDYKNATSANSFDNFSYNFNFDVRYVGDSEPTRIATQNLQVVADRDYVFVLGGTLDNPTVAIWESDERTWSGSETDFELRFGHVAGSFAGLDVYLVPENDVAGPGNLATTLIYGDVSAASEVAAGTYTIVATAADDIDDVVFQSDDFAYTAQTTLLVTFFDGDENELAPIAVRAIQPGGSTFAFADDRTTPTTRFVHLASDLGAVDIYDDEALTNRVVANQSFGEVSAEVPQAAGTRTITYTAPDDSGAVLLEDSVAVVAGTRIDLYAVGLDGVYDAISLLRDDRSVSVEARLSLFQGSANHRLVDIYVEEPGALIDDSQPDYFSIPLGLSTGNLPIVAGDYELWVTTASETTVLAGPYPISLALGDVVHLLLIDDPADTGIVEIRPIP